MSYLGKSSKQAESRAPTNMHTIQRKTRPLDASADHGTTHAYSDGIMKRTAKISRHMQEPTKAEKIAECQSNMNWWTKMAKQWEGVNPVEHARCMRIVNRAFEDIGRIEAGIKVAS